MVLDNEGGGEDIVFEGEADLLVELGGGLGDFSVILPLGSTENEVEL